MNLSKKIRDFLLRNKIQSFYTQELETVEDLVSLAKQDELGTSAEQVSKVNFVRLSLVRRTYES